MTSDAMLDLHEEPDRLLAERVMAGDEAAFRSLYRRHTPRLLQLASRLLAGDDAEAEDVVQDTWITAVEKLGTFRWEADLGTWLHAIGVNAAKSSLRRRGRRREVDLPDDGELAGAEPPDRVEPVDLERAIAALPAGYRTVFVLHDIEGETHERIAVQLGVTPGTTKSQLFRARRAVRARLAHDAGRRAT
ncbi:MAG TPA: sigma-70 family RNA polymerase sigma factor [Gemmatimonadales bacterium]|nr:sigma-70 family RNA polymerase sigma factor [Gemmatimonadales bacterium]